MTARWWSCDWSFDIFDYSCNLVWSHSNTKFGEEFVKQVLIPEDSHVCGLVQVSWSTQNPSYSHTMYAT